MYNYEWDIETGGYILLPSKITGVTKEVRPVFSEELRFLGLDRDYGWDFPDCEGPLMWAEARRYFYKGELVCEASGGGLYEMPTLKNVIKDLRITPVDIEMMLSKNESVMDSMAMWIEVKKFLLALADETLPLSKFCEGKDTTPNIKRVSAALKKVKKSQFVSPLSEYLRIIPEQAEPVIQKFIKADYQNNDNGKLRIYFLMYRMKSLLRAIPSDDPRAKDCIVLFETDEESDYKLTIIQKDL